MFEKRFLMVIVLPGTLTPFIGPNYYSLVDKYSLE